MKKTTGKNQKIAKGMPSAVLLSILIHATLFFLAGMLVVFTVVKKKEVEFVPPKAVERPKMKLKKPKVKIKKTSRPKPTTRIVTKMNRASMPDIQLPEMSGMGEGLAGGIDGFDIMPDFGETSVFGSGQSIGNDFEGVLYNFNRDRNGRGIPMDKETFRQKVRDFVLSGWNTKTVKKYYRLPKQLYTTHFMIPQIPTATASDVFGAPDLESYYFMVHYKGQLACTEPITFRFWGIGDAFMMIRVDGKEVFLNCWDQHRQYFDWWDSTSADDWKYYLGNQRMAVGDWITLEPGKPLAMDVLFGEWLGGSLSAMLNVEVQGVEYERNKQGGPILPAFKTAELSLDVLDEIYSHLPENESNLTNGPVFCDYSTPTEIVAQDAVATAEPSVIEPEPSSDGNTGMREWTLQDGRTFEAKLVAEIGDKVVFKNNKGKIIKIPQKGFSQEDLVFIQLENPPEFNISFSKQSEQRDYPDPLSGWASTQPQPKATRYVFSANVKQVSAGSYDQELRAEFFAVGTEVNGNRYVLLDRQEASFIPSEEHDRSIRFSGRTVELVDYQVGGDNVGWERRGKKYSSFMIVVTDSRGRIIAHETPKKWMFENLENLRQRSVGQYFDKTCTRVVPTRPKSRYY